MADWIKTFDRSESSIDEFETGDDKIDKKSIGDMFTPSNRTRSLENMGNVIG